MWVHFLKDYGDIKTGEIRNTENDEDAQKLIDSGIADKHIATKETEKDKEAAAIALKARQQEIIAGVMEKLKAENKRLPQPSGDENPSGFSSLGEFAKCVIGGKTNRKLMDYVDKTITGMGEAIGADGGFLIPAEFSTALLLAMAQAGTLAPKCLNFPANNNLTLPFVNLTTQALSWTGGCRIYKPAEGIAKSTSLPQLAQAELKLNKMTGVVYVTDELLSDSPIALETFLSTMVATEMALTKDEDIINGSGAGEALGVMNAPCLVSVAKETNQVAATINFENVLKMWMRHYAPAGGAVWLIAKDCMEQIGKLSVTHGTSGSSVFIVNASQAIPTNLFGAPIVWCKHCQTLGTAGDIILADFSQYVTISKAGAAGMETATSIHLRFLEDETIFRFVVRFDGQPWWASAVTPKHGNKTVSPFVALAVRE